MTPSPESVTPIVLKLFRTEVRCDLLDQRAVYGGHFGLGPCCYVAEVTEVRDTPTEPCLAPTETALSPSSGSSIDPFATPEQALLEPYLASQMGATNTGNWVYPSDPY